MASDTGPDGDFSIDSDFPPPPDQEEDGLLIPEDISDAPEGSDEGDASIAPGLDGVVIEKADRSLAELNRWFKSQRLIIDPEWQRSYVWDYKRASRLIESFLMDIPVPVIYLAKTEEGKYEVIDGVQRLTSVFRFLDNKFALSRLEVLKDLNKLTFGKLPAHLQSKLEDCTLRTFELSPRTSKNLLFVIFERLNTGGVALNEMEIRNCIYRGKLNNLIKRLAKYEPFRECTNQQNIERRMNDRSLVLRFLAFYEKGHQKVQAGLKEFLNDFFTIFRDPPDKRIEEFERKFQMSMKAAKTVFGDQGFRLRKTKTGVGGEWSANINASVFQVIATSFTQYDLSQLTRRADSIFEDYLDLTATDVNWVDCVTKSTGDASRIKYAFDKWNERLSEIMKGTDPPDSRRVFSRQLKDELWHQSRTCELCSQEIKLINDAAIDHVEHYWRGGRTIPENARLVHRLCNLKRPR